MAEFLGTYRGAAIYEITGGEDIKGHLLGTKVRAEGMLYDPSNMKVDFTEDAENREAALAKLKSTIDHYLSKHNLEGFSINNQ